MRLTVTVAFIVVGLIAVIACGGTDDARQPTTSALADQAASDGPKPANTPNPEPTLMNEGCQDPSRQQVRDAIEMAIREDFEESIGTFTIEWDTDPVTGRTSPGISDNRRWNEYSKRYARVVNADVILKSAQSSGQIKVWFSGVIYDNCTYNIWTTQVK